MAWKNCTEKVTCSLVSKPSVILALRTQHKVEILMTEYKSSEWLAYMVGKVQKEAIYVKDIVVPPHANVSSGSAEAEPFSIPKGCVGVIHSHHSMGAFHSNIDKEYVDSNWPCSITVATTHGGVKYDVVAAAKTPCGKPLQQDCTVLLERYKPDFDVEEWLTQAKENIDKGKKSVVVYGAEGFEWEETITGGYIKKYPKHKEHLYDYKKMEQEALGKIPGLDKMLKNKSNKQEE